MKKYIFWVAVAALASITVFSMGSCSGSLRASDKAHGLREETRRNHEKELAKAATSAFIRGACNGVRHCDLRIEGDSRSTRFVVRGMVYHNFPPNSPPEEFLPWACTGVFPPSQDQQTWRGECKVTRVTVTVS